VYHKEKFIRIVLPAAHCSNEAPLCERAMHDGMSKSPRGGEDRFLFPPGRQPFPYTHRLCSAIRFLHRRRSASSRRMTRTGLVESGAWVIRKRWKSTSRLRCHCSALQRMPPAGLIATRHRSNRAVRSRFGSCRCSHCRIVTMKNPSASPITSALTSTSTRMNQQTHIRVERDARVHALCPPRFEWRAGSIERGTRNLFVLAGDLL